MSKHKHKSIRNALLIVMLIAASVITIYAYLSASTGALKNEFELSATAQPSISEDFNDAKTLKQKVCVDVGNPGYAVYVRAAIVVTWKDESGNVYAQAPVLDTDYSMTLKTGDDDGWIKGDDGFYYHKTMVAYDGTTPDSSKTSILIETCQQLAAAPTENYSLHVEIIAQTIQALGTTDDDGTPAVEDAWGVTLDSNGKITKAP